MPNQQIIPWTPSSAEGRWCGFGPYYAMFPVGFVRRSLEYFCPPGGNVLDPFCGRGTTLFVAAVSGRSCLGADINPVAWLYSTVKLEPCNRPASIKKRVLDVLDSVRSSDREARNEFQKYAWHPEVLAFLNASRRVLNWRKSKIDQMLMGTILVHLHAKRGEGLSNQMRQSKSMSPSYSVRWWKRQKMRPPRIDVRNFFEKKLEWRYGKGIPITPASSRAKLGDSRNIFSRISEFGADFVLTSPPYCGLTNYEYDNWIRLWMLGGPPLPKHKNASRFFDRDKYYSMMFDVFAETRRLSKDSAIVYVRTDSRPFTLETTLDVLEEYWPRHSIFVRFDRAPGRTQTGLFQEKWDKAGEIDVVLTPGAMKLPAGFRQMKLT